MIQRLFVYYLENIHNKSPTNSYTLHSTTHITLRLCPLSVKSVLPVLLSHTRSVLSYDPETICLLSREYAQQVTYKQLLTTLYNIYYTMTMSFECEECVASVTIPHS